VRRVHAEAKTDPATITLPPDESGTLERLEMPGRAGLREPHDRGQFSDAQLLARQRSHQPPPRGLGEAGKENPRARADRLIVHCTTMHNMTAD
jgi:hypothetical protein